ncbi:ROK family protein [Nonomuraea sp. NPDC050404]|uniref:ROK family protein n=1 Tax=Nonomuraea sp. NPDC050404 TaxID=3155783 RepID=UPI0033ED2D13
MSTSESTPPAPLTAAIDIGGTKVAGAIVDAQAGLHGLVEHPTPAAGDARAVFAAVAAVVADLGAHPLWARTSRLGVGSAGPVHVAEGAVSPVNIPSWRTFPLVAELRRLPVLIGRSITLSGDGVAIAAAEHRHGAARGHRNALCMVVSTGIGGGLIIDGSPITGVTGNAGHIGHISVDLNGAACACGGIGCLEGIASGTSIARWAREQGWRGQGGESAKEVAASARQGDPIALAAFDRAARALGSAIASTATMLEIDLAVLGGGVAEAGDLLLDPLRKHYLSFAALPFARRADITLAQLGHKSGLIGAAVLAADADRLM